VPGSPELAPTKYDVSQAMSFVATRRNNAEERVTWQADTTSSPAADNRNCTGARPSGHVADCGHPCRARGDAMPLSVRKIVDISLELDDSNFRMRTPPGFKRDMQFQLEVLKEHDAAEGAGQIVRGVHMRLHAGSHVDAPEHNVKGGKQIHDLPLETFAGDAVIADLRHLVPGGAVTAQELENAAGSTIQRGDRLLLRTDVNKTYMTDDWMKRSPYLTSDATRWCIEKGVVLVGYDFYHGVDEPAAPRTFNSSRTLSEAGIVTLPYLSNLDRVTEQRVTLLALPLKLVGAEASPVRAVLLA
jgi:arylformamidase